MTKKGPESKRPKLDHLPMRLKKKKVAERVKALESLSKIEDPRINQEIVKLLTDRSPSVRSIAAELLGAAGGKKAIVSLTKRLADSNKEVRMMAARSLGRILEGQSSPPALINRLKDTDELVRTEVCESLGAIGDPKALAALWKATHDNSALVRSYAAGAIGELGDARDIAKLEGGLSKERSDTAKVGFCQALYKLGRSDVTSGLLTLLRSSDYRVRCATTEILSNVVANESNAQTILGALEKALRHELTPAAKSSMRSGIRDIRKRISNV